jgi:hypothetical protein
MTNLHVVEGVFRDRGQAALAIAAARHRGLHVPECEDLFEDAAGQHVVLRTTTAAEEARRLLLDYGAYSATIS